MRLRIASDLHLEFYTYKSHISRYGRDMNECVILPKMDNESEQVLILAGDICCVNQISQWSIFFEKLSKRFKKIITIMGNHEHYHNDYNTTYRKLQKFYEQFDIKLLEQSYVEVDDVLIYGATLWTDFNNQNPLDMLLADNSMPDYQYINNGSDNIRLRPITTCNECVNTLNDIKFFSELKDDRKKIVVSHHTPSLQSVSPKFKNHQLNYSFVNNFDDFVYDSAIDLWVHGHVHSNHDYMIGNTRVVCNPFGYYNENKKGYIKDLVLTI